MDDARDIWPGGIRRIDEVAVAADEEYFESGDLGLGGICPAAAAF